MSPRAPKDDHPRRENTATQPLAEFAVFNRPDVLTEGWYPALPTRELGRGQARSVVIGPQRVALYRTEAGDVHALDAFCAHMGADLANGRVVGDRLECYFHQWQYGPDGAVAAVRTGRRPEGACVAAWPAAEGYGWIWVWAGREAAYPLPRPPGLEGEVVAWHLASPTLFAHHHVMMVGGIDQQHFVSVHGLDVRFELQVQSAHPEVQDWRLEGALSPSGWRSRLGAWLFGGKIRYDARFAGGTVVTLAYGPGLRWFGGRRAVPPLYLYWGCVPLREGVSRVEVFALAPRGPGAFGGLLARLRLLLTLVLLTVLRDDDVKAFPNMRFNPGRLTAEDAAVARLIRFLEGLRVSPWTPGRKA